jgi:hypothetical protein
MFNSSNVYQKPSLVNYLSLGCGGKKALALKLTIKFLIALTNDTCADGTRWCWLQTINKDWLE